jgi:6-pyruvoyl-tetrahydropterin synthase
MKMILADLDNYSEFQMQRFNLTLVSNEQVRLCFEDPDQNELYYQISEESLEQLSSSPEVSLEILSNDSPGMPENQIILLLEEYLNKLKIADLHDHNYGLINVSFSDENPHEKYVYYFHCNKIQKVVNLISTRNQRKYHNKVLLKFQEFAKREGYSLEVYSEYTRIIFINSCPEIFLAFCLQKVVEELAPFLEVFKTMAFNSVAFILDDPDGSEMILSSDQGMPSHLDSGKSEFLLFF